MAGMLMIAHPAGEVDDQAAEPEFWFRQHFYGIPISVFRGAGLPSWEWTELRREWTIYVDPNGVGLVHDDTAGMSVLLSGPEWYTLSKVGMIELCLSLVRNSPFLRPLITSRIAG